MDRFRRLGIRLLTTVVVLGVSPASTAAAQPTELFSPLPPESTVLSSERDSLTPGEAAPSSAHPPRPVPWLGGETIRRRTAHIDLEYLATTRARLVQDPTEAVALVLNLFPDARFRARDVRVKPTLTGFSLSGGLEDFEFGTITIAVSGNIVAGSLRTEHATYAIRSTGDGLVEIRQVDPTTLPPGAEPLVPPREASPPQAPLPRASATGTGEDTVIDVLMLWTPTAREEVGGAEEIRTLIDLYVAEANQACRDSGVSIAVNLVYSQELDYVESDQGLLWDLGRLSDHEGHIDEVLDLRDRVGADLVQLVVGEGLGFCGVAWGWILGTYGDGRQSLAPGFLTSMHDVAPLSEDGYVVPIFNPASNVDQVSRLRIVNPGDAEATVTVNGIDDRGVARGPVSVSVPGLSARDYSSQELESGGARLDGQLGDGLGKWTLIVSSDESVQVMSLLQSPTGHLANLSSSPEAW